MVVVIIGITIAFSLNSWRDYQQHKDLEREYLLGISSDLENDQGFMAFVLRDDSVKARQLDSLIGFSFYSQAAPAKLAFRYLTNNGYYVPFKGQNTTYTALMSSGGLQTISDFDLRQKIVRFYSQEYNSLHEIDQAITTHVQKYTLDYFVRELKVDSSGIHNMEKLQNTFFQNSLFGQKSLLERRQDFYQRVNESARRLNAEIETKL